MSNADADGPGESEAPHLNRVEVVVAAFYSCLAAALAAAVCEFAVAVWHVRTPADMPFLSLALGPFDALTVSAAGTAFVLAFLGLLAAATRRAPRHGLSDADWSRGGCALLVTILGVLLMGFRRMR